MLHGGKRRRKLTPIEKTNTAYNLGLTEGYEFLNEKNPNKEHQLNESTVTKYWINTQTKNVIEIPAAGDHHTAEAFKKPQKYGVSFKSLGQDYDPGKYYDPKIGMIMYAAGWVRFSAEYATTIANGVSKKTMTGFFTGDDMMKMAKAMQIVTSNNIEIEAAVVENEATGEDIELDSKGEMRAFKQTGAKPKSKMAAFRESDQINNADEAVTEEEKEKADLPDLEVGDELMVGKFKNRKAEIKGFKKDKHNQPVAKTNKGDQTIFKGRVKKIMPESDVVSELKAYHGSGNAHQRFNTTHSGNNSHTFGSYNSERYGVFFTNNPKFAELYGDVYQYDLQVSNPLNLDSQDGLEVVYRFQTNKELDRQIRMAASEIASYGRNIWMLFEDEIGEAFVKFLKEEGYDSAQFTESHTEDDEEIESLTTVVLNPSKIEKDGQIEMDIYESDYRDIFK